MSVHRAVRSSIAPILAFLFASSALAQNIAPQRGGATNGPPIIDSAGPLKGGTISLDGDRSSCLSPQIDTASVTVTDSYEAGTMYMANRCSVPIAFAYCSVGPVDDGFNCAPNGNRVLAKEGLTAYDQGAWQVGPNQSATMPISTKNRVVWYACDDSPEAGNPHLTAVNPPMGRCWKPPQSKAPDASPSNPLDRLLEDQGKRGASTNSLDGLLQDQVEGDAAATRQHPSATASGANAGTPTDPSACRAFVVSAGNDLAVAVASSDPTPFINQLEQEVEGFITRHAPAAEVEQYFLDKGHTIKRQFIIPLKQCVLSHL